MENEIAKKYSVSEAIIAYIRSCYIGLHLKREQMISRQEYKIENLRKIQFFLDRHPNTRKHKTRCKELECFKEKEETKKGITRNIQQRQLIMAFLESITDSQFKDITR